MTESDILKVAREVFPYDRLLDREFIAFASRIAAMQREKDAQICEQVWGGVGARGEAGLCAEAIRSQSDE